MSEIVPVTTHLLRGMPPPDPTGDSKDGRGRVLVVAGCLPVPGAVLLCATGVLRAGAGKVQIATCRDLAVPIGLAIPEALVVGLDQTEGGCIAGRGGDALAERASHCDAVLIGPGMMDDADAATLACGILRGAPGPGYVLDAGALGALAADPDLLRRGGTRAIITPHAGEMARLLGRERAAIEADPLGAAREASERFGTVTVMKGGATQIVGPDGAAYCYESGHVGLATAGSGDTLAGLVAGLLARGTDPLAAALWGVCIHGETGRRLAHRYGGLGFLAREILDEAPRVLGEMLG